MMSALCTLITPVIYRSFRKRSDLSVIIIIIVIVVVVVVVVVFYLFIRNENLMSERVVSTKITTYSVRD